MSLQLLRSGFGLVALALLAEALAVTFDHQSDSTSTYVLLYGGVGLAVVGVIVTTTLMERRKLRSRTNDVTEQHDLRGARQLVLAELRTNRERISADGIMGLLFVVGRTAWDRYAERLAIGLPEETFQRVHRAYAQLEELDKTGLNALTNVIARRASTVKAVDTAILALQIDDSTLRTRLSGARG